MARHRAPRRRGHVPSPAQPPAADDHPKTNPELTVPPWLRVVRSPEDVLADPPADPVHVLPATPKVQVAYPNGERLTVPITDGMVIQLSCVDGEPRIGFNLA